MISEHEEKISVHDEKISRLIDFFFVSMNQYPEFANNWQEIQKGNIFFNSAIAARLRLRKSDSNFFGIILMGQRKIIDNINA